MNEHGTTEAQTPENATSESAEQTQPKSKWRPLTSRQRRVAGVLVEKARTTPDAYPLSLNGLTTGCNQKSNRDPQMNLSADEVEDTLDELRQMGAVAEVHSGGRVPKYRHYLYEWLGVDKHEMAIMAELLLRGDQTLGDLRARASRMEPIADQAQLKQLLEGLIERGLVVALSPPGRGQVVTHGLYTEKEWERRGPRGDFGIGGADAADDEPESSPRPRSSSRVDELEQRVATLEQTVSELQEKLQQLMG